MTSALISTKIPLLDEALGGGFEAGSATVYWSDKEAEASSLALQTLHNRLKEGDAAVIVETTKKSRQVLEAAQELGFDLGSLPITFVDAFSAIYEGRSDDRLFVKSPNDIEELVAAVTRALGGAKGRRTLLVFDSFSAYIDRFEPISNGIDIVGRLVQLFRENNATGVFVFTEWAYEPSLLDQVRRAFSAVVRLEATPQGPTYSMQVTKANLPGPAEAGRKVFFRVLKPGGVRIYLPKILITGPFHAGKSSFIRSVGKGTVSVDRLGTTVALDYAHVDHKGFAIDLFGTPGQSRFDPLLEKLGDQALGLIVVVSATDRIGLGRVRGMIRSAKAERLPYVIAANKVNLRGAISLTAMRNLMKVPKKIPMIPMHAKSLSQVRPGLPCDLDPKDVEKVLDAVVDQIEKTERIGKTV